MMILGFALAYGYSQMEDDKAIIYIYVLAAGIILYIVSKVRIWWNHS